VGQIGNYEVEEDMLQSEFFAGVQVPWP